VPSEGARPIAYAAQAGTSSASAARDLQ